MKLNGPHDCWLILMTSVSGTAEPSTSQLKPNHGSVTARAPKTVRQMPSQNSRRARNTTSAMSSRSIRTSASSPITSPSRPGLRSPA